MSEKREVIIDIDLEPKDFDKEIGNVNKQLKENRSLIKELSQNYDENATEIAKLERQNKKLSKTKRDLIKQSETENNSLNALRRQLARLTKERDNLDTSVKGNTERFEQLQREIKQTSDEIKGFEQAGGDFRRNVGNYTESVTEALGQTNFFGVSVGDLASKFTSVVGVIGAVGAGLGALTNAYLSTGRGANQLARIQDRLSTITERLGNSIADLVGDDGKMSLLDQILFNLEASFFGFGSAFTTQGIADLKKEVRNGQLFLETQEIQSKTLLDNAERLRQIRDDERNSFEERTKANERLLDVINQRETFRINALDAQIKKVRLLLNTDKENAEWQQELNRLLLEKADIQEESQGFRSEALSNEISLLKEQNTLELEFIKLQLEAAQLQESTSAEAFDLRQKIIDKQYQLELKAAGENQQAKLNAEQKFLNESFKLRQEFASETLDLEKTQEEKIKEILDNVVVKQYKIDEDRYRSTQIRIRNQEIAEQMLVNNTIGLLGALGENNKAFALLQIAADTGRALSGALANANSPTIDNVATGGVAGIAKYVGLAATIVSNANRARQIVQARGNSSISASGDVGGGRFRSSVQSEELSIIQPQLLSQFSQPVQNQNEIISSRTQNISPIVSVVDIKKGLNNNTVKVKESSLG